MSSSSTTGQTIYVSGPYSAARGVAEADRPAAIAANVARANEAAMLLAERGHVPFVPHTMMRGWEDEANVTRERAMAVCLAWVDRCDAMLVLGDSPGTSQEVARATQRGLPIFYAVDDVPAPVASELLEAAREAYLVEYAQTAESYRHTYATIWQAGALFAAISAAVLALTGDGGGKHFDVPPLIRVVAPLPFLFWWYGVFRPMNAYGEWRSDRLKTIERRLNAGVPGLHMNHFTHYTDTRRDGEEASLPKRAGRRVLRPRVNWVVNAFGLAVFLCWLLLVVDVAFDPFGFV